MIGPPHGSDQYDMHEKLVWRASSIFASAPLRSDFHFGRTQFALIPSAFLSHGCHERRHGSENVSKAHVARVRVSSPRGTASIGTVLERESAQGRRANVVGPGYASNVGGGELRGADQPTSHEREVNDYTIVNISYTGEQSHAQQCNSDLTKRLPRSRLYNSGPCTCLVNTPVALTR